MLAAFLIVWPTSFAELGVIPLWIVAGVRWRVTAERTAALWRDPAVRLLAAWGAWMALSLAWSPDRDEGLQELAQLRWLALLWPITLVTEARPRIVAALLAGFATGHLVQIANAIALQGLAPEFLRFNRAPDRISGWWDPAVSGVLLTAALGAHLALALWSAGRLRLVGAIGSVVTLVALLATGARGGWIASAALLALAGALALYRGRRSAATLGTIAAAAIAIGVTAFAMRGLIASRFDEARTAVAAAIDEQDYDSDTGTRILMKIVAVDAFASAPIHGLGAGGFIDAWRRELEGSGSTRIHGHAHDTPLHLLATQGAVGFAMLATGAGWILIRAWRRSETGLDAAPRLALVGVLLCAPFDALTASTHSAAISGLLLALAWRPPPVNSSRQQDSGGG